MKKSTSICISLTLIALLIVSCDSTDDMPTFDKVDVVTGIYLNDLNGQLVGLWNYPNEKAGDATVYPNPFVDVMAFSSLSKFKNLWIIPADCLTDGITADVTNRSLSLDFKVSEVQALELFEYVNNSDLNSINLNLESLDSGFYRLFYENESEEVFWINLYKITEEDLFENLNEVLDSVCVN